MYLSYFRMLFLLCENISFDYIIWMLHLILNLLVLIACETEVRPDKLRFFLIIIDGQVILLIDKAHFKKIKLLNLI